MKIWECGYSGNRLQIQTEQAVWGQAWGSWEPHMGEEARAAFSIQPRDFCAPSPPCATGQKSRLCSLLVGGGCLCVGCWVAHQPGRPWEGARSPWWARPAGEQLLEASPEGQMRRSSRVGMVLVNYKGLCKWK